jgi:hypothetical protein
MFILYMDNWISTCFLVEIKMQKAFFMNAAWFSSKSTAKFSESKANNFLCITVIRIMPTNVLENEIKRPSFFHQYKKPEI